MDIQIGDVFTWERTFSEKETLAFAELTGDKGRHHMIEYHRPVFTGDTITCEFRITNVIQKEGYKFVEITSVYRNQDGKEVVTGSSSGIINNQVD